MLPLHDSHNILDFLDDLVLRAMWTSQEAVHGQPKELHFL